MPNSGSIYKPLYISEYSHTGIPSAKPAHTVIPLKKWHKNLNTLEFYKTQLEALEKSHETDIMDFINLDEDIKIGRAHV